MNRVLKEARCGVAPPRVYAMLDGSNMLSTDFILLRRLRLNIDLIPGPPHNDAGLYNQAIQVIARYSADEAAGAFGKIANVSLVTDGSADPRAWQWVWRDGDRSIRLGFTVMGKETEVRPIWGGSTLAVNCFVGDLLGFWRRPARRWRIRGCIMTGGFTRPMDSSRRFGR